MAQVIIHENENGGVSITYPTPEFLETNTIEDVLAKDCPDHAIIIEDSELPESQEFFDAWELVDGNVLVNMNKAKEITKTRLRTEREPLLQAQDVAFQRALESGVDTKEIVAEKQRLRDITNLVDPCISTSELRNIKVQ